MPKLKIYSASVAADGTWRTFADIEGLDDAGVAIPGTRKTVVISMEQMQQITAVPLAQRGGALLGMMDQIDSSLGKANLARLIAANLAGSAATTTFLASLNFPVTLTYP